MHTSIARNVPLSLSRSPVIHCNFFLDSYMCINLITLPTRSFNALQPLTAFTAISTPYISASFSTPNVYLACNSDSLTQSTIPHLSIFPYSCSLATYILTPTLLPLTFYFALSIFVLCSLPHTLLLLITLLTTYNPTLLLSLKPGSVPLLHL